MVFKEIFSIFQVKAIPSIVQFKVTEKKIKGIMVIVIYI